MKAQAGQSAAEIAAMVKDLDAVERDKTANLRVIFACWRSVGGFPGVSMDPKTELDRLLSAAVGKAAPEIVARVRDDLRARLEAGTLP